jgi:hypothetical protein
MVDEMTVNEMIVDKMSLDKMTVDEMLWRQNESNNLEGERRESLDRLSRHG